MSTPYVWVLRVLAFCCFLEIHQVQAFSTVGASQRAESNRRWWPFDDGIVFTEHGDDLSPPHASSDANPLVDVPGEGPILDEEVPVPMPRLRPRLHHAALASMSSAKPVRPMVPEMPGATPVSDVADSFSTSVVGSATPPSVKAASHVAATIDEYDTDDGDEADERHGDADDDHAERMTEEDLERKRRGEVSAVHPSQLRHTAVHPSQLRHGTAYLARVGAQAQSAQSVVADASDRVGVVQLSQSQCLAFANHMKTQGIKGVELVRVWKGTCDPGVMAGIGGPQYSTMCSALGGAVGQFANLANWDPNQVCMAVLQVFQESNVGATPA